MKYIEQWIKKKYEFIAKKKVHLIRIIKYITSIDYCIRLEIFGHIMILMKTHKTMCCRITMNKSGEVIKNEKEHE